MSPEEADRLQHLFDEYGKVMGRLLASDTPMNKLTETAEYFKQTNGEKLQCPVAYANGTWCKTSKLACDLKTHFWAAHRPVAEKLQAEMKAEQEAQFDHRGVGARRIRHQGPVASRCCDGQGAWRRRRRTWTWTRTRWRRPRWTGPQPSCAGECWDIRRRGARRVYWSSAGRPSGGA